MPDWLEDGVTGFLAEASLPESLAAALKWGWQAQWPAMEQRAYERARTQIQLDPAAELLHLLQEVAGQPPQ